MRTKLYFLFVLGCALCIQANAKIWRVNNNGAGQLPLIASDFPASTTLQQVHDNASVANGDTIHLEQSPTSYGNCVFTKRLVVIGAGYFLNLNPKTQVNQSFGSIVGNLTLQNAGSAGSVITGLTQNATAQWFVGANNVTITRNLLTYAVNARLLIGSGNATNCDNISVYQNYIGGSSNTYCVQTASGTTGNITNLNITGNIVLGVYGINMGTNASGILKNNFVATTYNAIVVANMYVVNNMSQSSNAAYNNQFDNCTIEYNMGTYASHFVSPGGNGNTFGSGNQTVAYASWNLLGGSSTDGQYQLTASSPAKGAGKSGDDMGAFGSSIPYKLSGIAAVPNVYAMTIGAIAAGATSISVTVSAKSNN